MYVTRRLSHYKKFPESLSLPPEGPNSGYLVIQDEEAETYSCFGLCKNRYLMDLPLPQNKDLGIRYSTGAGQNRSVHYYDVAFIPILNQPLSCNLYYAIKPHGNHKGEAFTCSTEEDMTACCFCNCIQDLKPRPLNPNDIFQQFEIVPHETICYTGGRFYAKSVARDGFPPRFLRRKGWEIYTKTPKHYELGEALGVNAELCACLPAFDFPLFYTSSQAIVVAKWYCPFMFIKEGTPRDQMKRSMFYEMTLTQKWEQIFNSENYNNNEGNTVFVDVAVQKEAVFVAAKEAAWDDQIAVHGAIWFTSFGNLGEEIRVGLSLAIIERIKWEQQRVGWVAEERQVRVKRAEEFGGAGGWSKFGCYVLVQSFVIKRMDGSLVMTYDFKHTHQIKSKWE